MAKKDIYKIDNYFITWGYILFFVSSISMALDPFLWNEVSIRSVASNGAYNYTFESKDGRSLAQIEQEKGPGFTVEERSFPYIRTFLAINGMLLLIVGYTYRGREKKIIAMWNAIERTGEARVGDLSLNLGLPREFILKHLKDINVQTQGAYSYDSRTDKIVNNRLLTEFLVLVDCVSCGNKINQKVSLDLSNPPRCNYCGTGVPADHLNKLKHEVLLSIQATPAPATSEFSVGIFILLLVLFWPAAVIYVIKKKVMGPGGVVANATAESGQQFADALNALKQNRS
jgi:hypothetical protein